MMTQPSIRADITTITDDGGTAVLNTEAGVTANLAVAATAPYEVEVGSILQVTTPPGSTSAIVDTAPWGSGPRRGSGTATFWDAPSFVAYVKRHRDPGTEVYYDVKASSVTAVLNGDADLAEDAVTPYGWGDWRAVLNVRHTLEWDRWSAADGRLMSQVDFAEFIEGSLPEIREPVGTVMLELAQTFAATTGVDFEASTMLDNGQRRLLYKETTTAKAGQTGDIVVPKELTLALRPYEGSDPFAVTARFRYRIVNTNLQLGVVLNRVEDVLEAAFADIRTLVENGLEVELLAGTPPQPRQ